MANLNLDTAHSAVLSMDLQHAMVTNNAMAKQRDLIGKVKGVLDGARSSGILVTHIVYQPRAGFTSPKNKYFSAMAARARPSTPAEEAERFRIADAFIPVGNEPVIQKPRVNAFYGSSLEAVLRAKDITTLILMGIGTSMVVESTARYASDADYRVIVLEDCCASGSEDSHKASIVYLSGLVEVAASADFLESIKKTAGA